MENLHKEVIVKTEILGGNVEKDERSREESLQNVMKMINHVVEEVKKDLQEERRQHEQSKTRLLSLFESATDKLNNFH